MQMLVHVNKFEIWNLFVDELSVVETVRPQLQVDFVYFRGFHVDSVALDRKQ